jgi:hypothetical protein
MSKIAEDLMAIRIAERNILERHARPAHDQWCRPWNVAQLVRDEQRPQRFGQPCHVLGHVDERDREIAGGVQNGESKGADQDDLAGACLAALPQHDRPHQQPDRQNDRHHRMQEPQPFEIAQAALACSQFAIERRIEAAVLACDAAERAHDRHVADHVDHLAVDRGGLVSKIMMQRLSGGGEAKHGHDHDGRNDHQQRGHRAAHGQHQRNCAERSQAGRQHVPDEHVFEHIDGVRGRRDAARQHARHAIHEIAWRVSGQMSKQVAAQVAGDARKCVARDPAGQSPQQVVACDQGNEDKEGEPHILSLAVVDEAVDQEFNAILRADSAADSRQNAAKDDGVGIGPAAQIAKNEAQRPVGVLA